MKKEQSYGVVVVYQEEEYKFLLLRHTDTKDDNWSFPKGHIEEGETPIQTAMRELKEESGITQIQILDKPLIYEAYEINHHGEKCLKVNEYFIGFVDSKEVKIQDGEIADYKWATYDEARKTFNYQSRKDILKTAKEYLENMIK